MPSLTSHGVARQNFSVDWLVEHVEERQVPSLSRAWTLLIIVFLAINTLLVILRYLSWYTSGVNLQIYDILVLPSWAFCVAACGCILGDYALISTVTV